MITFHALLWCSLWWESETLYIWVCLCSLQQSACFSMHGSAVVWCFIFRNCCITVQIIHNILSPNVWYTGRREVCRQLPPLSIVSISLGWYSIRSLKDTRMQIYSLPSYSDCHSFFVSPLWSTCTPNIFQTNVHTPESNKVIQWDRQWILDSQITQSRAIQVKKPSEVKPQILILTSATWNLLQLNFMTVYPSIFYSSA